MKIEKKSSLYDGKSKTLFETNHSDLVIQYFKDDATAFNALKKGQIRNKGFLNNSFSTHLFLYLKKLQIESHFVEKLSEREMLVQKLKIIPVEVVVRNRAAGSLCKRLGIEKGKVLRPPLVEYFLKDDSLGDPLVGETHIQQFGWATLDEVFQMKQTALQVNQILSSLFEKIGLSLVDFKLEFGKNSKNQVLLADEITLDGCRLWDHTPGESMDKDRFRLDLGKVDEAYEEVFNRLNQYFMEQK